MLNPWQVITNNHEKQHPKCIGKECETWDLCNNCETYVLIVSCIYYDDEAEDQMIDDEIKAGI